MRTFHKQRGWIGLLALVFAAMMVALMARSALKEYGLLTAGDKSRPEAGARERSKDVLRGAASSAPNSLGSVDPGDAMNRVRQLGSTVRQQAEELDERTRNAERQ